jgi:lysyl-tRNA synthetase class 2
MTERERLADRIGNLHKRARLNRAIREFFDEQGFLEIDAPILVWSPGMELHLDAFRISDGALHLNTSPEYQMKRLLAGGLERIYSLGRVFRRGELGPHHNPEFTMLEWYRANAGWQAIADDVEQLVARAAQALNGSTRLGADGACDVAPPWERLSMTEAMRRYAAVELYGDEPTDVLRERVRAAGHRVPQGDAAWDDIFFTVFLDAVEPHLGRARPTILYDWPRPLAALARAKPDDPRVVERFEAYAGGVELCNGFGELIDPQEQRRRFEQDLAERRRRGLPIYPIDSQFLSALADMPPSGGVALGVDRLAMLLTGARDIRDVLPFKLDEV